MSKPDTPKPEPPDKSQPADERGGESSSVLSGMFTGMRNMGRDVISVALGRLLESQEQAEADDQADPKAAPTKQPSQRVNMLHRVTEQLRGAADDYVAAKLDELEARVDDKLDHIEKRIDHKIVELHEQLAEMRDRELRHRLRLLKITLIFTALVAVLSLLYKWVEKAWQLG